MVSTRPKSRYYFEKGEKVLCYEPDVTKAKVLYDSKILGIHESKDKRGRKVIQYKVHFQGWSSSWDRKVNADFVLKDTVENRQLQRDLAEKAQLHLGAYLYRKDHGSNNKKRSRKSTSSTTLPDETVAAGSVVPTSTTSSTSVSGVAAVGNTSPEIRARVSSEDNFSSGSTFEKHEDFPMKDECETESCCSSIESFHDEERVMLRISERLRQYLEYDHDMIVKYNKQHTLPARIPVLTILENFVKQSAVKLVFSATATQSESTRRRTTQLRTDKKEREFDKLVSTVGLLKEVADGLRIYFDFTIADYLLYKEEKDYALFYLSEENLKHFLYVASPGLSPDFLTGKSDLEQNITQIAASISEGSTVTIDASANDTFTPTVSAVEEPQKRKLRSHRSDDCDLMLENCLSSIASTSSGASTPMHTSNISSNINYLKSFPTMSLSIPPQTRDFLQGVLSWCLLPTNATPTPSMIFGAPHLARLIVKLPEFLNASPMNDEKLKTLLQHLDTFINFLEARKEWFNEDNYLRSSTTSKTAAQTTITSSNTTTQEENSAYSSDSKTTTTKHADPTETAKEKSAGAQNPIVT